MKHFTYVTGCAESSETNKRSFSIKTTKLVFFGEANWISILSHREKTRIQLPGFEHLYISSFFECSPPKMLLHTIGPRRPIQALLKLIGTLEWSLVSLKL